MTWFDLVKLTGTEPEHGRLQGADAACYFGIGKRPVQRVLTRSAWTGMDLLCKQICTLLVRSSKKGQDLVRADQVSTVVYGTCSYSTSYSE